MGSDLIKASRGRPKTIDRQRILDVAMQAYWIEGVYKISLNEICRRAKVSKPGLYREFGNEDGLMEAVLSQYKQQVLVPILQMLKADAPFRETLNNLVSFMVSDDREVPKGCLLVKMRESSMHMGEATRELIDRTHEQVLTAYEDWVESSKAKGEFVANVPTQLVATYIDAQLSNALSQMARGEQSNTVRAVLTMAFSVLV